MSQDILQLASALSLEKGFEFAEVLEALESALARVVSYEQGKMWEVRAHIDPSDGNLRLWRLWHVVAEEDEIENPEAQILATSEQATKHNAAVGDVVEEELPALNLKRVNARLSKQFLHQKLREISAEKRQKSFQDSEGQIVMGTVRRIESEGYYVEVQKFELLLRREQLLPGESFAVGARVCAVVDSVGDLEAGSQVCLSRTSPKFLQELFYQEVPEVADGLVQVIDCARDPGSRAKVSVTSRDTTVDPVGACIGMRGVRIQAITNELCGEKIDIVLWSEDMAKYLINIFSVAEVKSVVIDESQNAAEVVVSDETLSLAIGRGGQNVKLARQLIKKRIDLLCESEAEKKSSEEVMVSVTRLQEALELDEIMAHLLVLEGYDSLEKITSASVEELMGIEGFNEDVARELIERAQSAHDTGADAEAAEVAKPCSQEMILLLEREGLLHVQEALSLHGIVTPEDLAWLAVDEFQEITNNAVDEAVAVDVIMRLRKPLISE